MKTYYCLDKASSRRIIVQAANKKAAAANLGISTDMLAVCRDPKAVEAASEIPMVETGSNTGVWTELLR